MPNMQNISEPNEFKKKFTHKHTENMYSYINIKRVYEYVLENYFK